MRTVEDGLTERASEGWRPGPIGIAGLFSGAVAGLLGLWGGRSAAVAELDGHGLIAVLPAVYWAAVLLGALATGLLLQAAVTEHRGYAQAVPPLWLLVLHVGPHLAPVRPGSAVVWEHIALARMIDGSGSVEVAADGRFAWPGGLAVLMAVVADLGDPALETLIRLWPGLLLGGTAVLVSALARRSYPSVPLIGPMAAVVYLLLSWTGQDELLPQGFGFVATLALLVLIESGPLRATADWSTSITLLDRFGAAAGDRPFARSRVAFATLLTLGMASIVSSPIAPVFVCFILLLLGLHGRRAAYRLLGLLSVGYLLWLAIAAQPWWSGSDGGLLSGWSELLGGAPAVSDGAASTAQDRVAAARLAAGVFTFASIVVIGVAMATERFRHLRPAIPLAPPALVPAVVLAGGFIDRDRLAIVGFFVLPAAAVLLARCLATIRLRLAVIALPALLVAITPVLLLARYGGETSEPIGDEPAAESSAPTDESTSVGGGDDG